MFETDGAKVVVDDISLELLSGSKVDYTMELIKRSFVIVGELAMPGYRARCHATPIKVGQSLCFASSREGGGHHRDARMLPSPLR